MNKDSEFLAISPIDGRYREQIEKLSAYFSEMALFKYRVKIEILYLLALANEAQFKEFARLSPVEKKFLENIYKRFSLKDLARIKKIEEKTHHDVKAVEYFIKGKIARSNHKKLKDGSEFVHFALTSEDVNNLAYSLMMKDAIDDPYKKELAGLIKYLLVFVKKYKDTPLLSLTHGQPATPTTFGKEFAVFVARLKRQQKQLHELKLQGKLGGAVGNWAAHMVAYPKINWIEFSKKFISNLGLEPNLLTIQIEPHDSLAELFDILKRINNIIIDLDQDLWSYTSRGLFVQEVKAGEVGSSTMPHKMNPIFFENSEGNLQVANAMLIFLGDKLTKSRMQRDLTDSTVLRNQGVAVAHCLLGIRSLHKGLKRISINNIKAFEELEDNPEVLAEAIQILLRKAGVEKPYEKIKQLTRGKEISINSIHKFIDTLDISNKDKAALKKLKPEDYTGLSSKLTNLVK